MRFYITGNEILSEQLTEQINNAGFVVYNTNDNTNRLNKIEYKHKLFSGEYRKSLVDSDKKYRYLEVIQENKVAIRWCDMFVLVLPSDHDGHVEFGIALESHKSCHVIGAPPDSKSCFYHGFAKNVYADLESFIENIKQVKDKK